MFLGTICIDARMWILSQLFQWIQPISPNRKKQKQNLARVWDFVSIIRVRAYTMIRIHNFNRYIFTVLVFIWNFFRPLSSSYVLKTLSLSPLLFTCYYLFVHNAQKLPRKKKFRKNFVQLKSHESLVCACITVFTFISWKRCATENQTMWFPFLSLGSILITDDELFSLWLLILQVFLVLL